MAEASYQVVITPDAKYAVCVFEPGVLPQYVPGFESEAAARQWITDERQKSITPHPKGNTGLGPGVGVDLSRQATAACV